jgi:hypothetical protein
VSEPSVNHPPTDWASEPPVDHAELCQRVRFSLDDPPQAPPGERQRRIEGFRKQREFCRSSLLRATAALMPGLHRTVQEVSERLLLRQEPEVFVRADPMANASALPAIPGEPAAIVLHSSTIDLLEPGELAAVIGHELGHVALDHGGQYREGDSGASKMFELENARSSEVSSDRIGLLAAPSLEVALMSEIKMMTGLQSSHLRLDIPAILENFSRRCEDFDREWEISTHPQLAFRFWAQIRFAETDLYRRLRGLGGGQPFDQVEKEIEDRFLSLGAGIAFRAAADVVHEALAWLGVLVVSEDGIVDEREREALVRHVGVLWAEDACTYAARHGRKAVERRAKETVRELAITGSRTRQRLERQLRELSEAAGGGERAHGIIAFMRQALSDEA